MFCFKKVIHEGNKVMNVDIQQKIDKSDDLKHAVMKHKVKKGRELSKHLGLLCLSFIYTYMLYTKTFTLNSSKLYL